MVLIDPFTRFPLYPKGASMTLIQLSISCPLVTNQIYYFSVNGDDTA